MIKLSINLPTRYKLHLSLVKRHRSRDEKPLIPSMGEVRSARTGSKISRFFKLIFEHKNIRRILGANMAFLVFASNLMPSTTSALEAEETVVAVPAVNLKTERIVRYPVANISITQGYAFFHPGIDLDGVTGEAIYPIMKGVVVGISNSNFAYGNAILISHNDGLTSLYAHLSKINVKVGQEVTTKDTIGLMGATGRAFGDHLHLEIRDQVRSVNPLTVLPH